MKIDINQKKLSIRTKYNVYVNGKESFIASKELLTFFSVINLFNISGNITTITMHQKWSWFATRYNLKFNTSQDVVEFRTKSFWKLHFQCAVANDYYDVYGHRGRKYSIYKNDVQIAFWDKKAVSWFSGDNYSIIADNEANQELLIAFCLILDNAKRNDKDGATVTYDFGNIGGQIRKFNPDWTPK